MCDKYSVLLSIIIPTYNRFDFLIENIKSLLPQVKKYADEVELIVLDNCSEIPVDIVLEKALTEDDLNFVSMERNLNNIGLIGNSLRLFEYGTGKYIWSLCDDDIAQPNAVETIINCIKDNLSCIYLWFPVIGGPSHRFPGFYRGLSDCIIKEPNLFFVALSSCVFERNFFSARIRFGYLYASSWVPFLCPLISDIENKNNYVFISKISVAQVINSNSKDKWSKLDVCINIHSILDLPMSNKTRDALRKSINSFCFSTSRLFLDSVLAQENTRWFLFIRYIRQRYAPFSFYLLFWLVLTYLAKTLPHLTLKFIRLFEVVIKRQLLLEPEDRFTRS